MKYTPKLARSALAGSVALMAISAVTASAGADTANALEDIISDISTQASAALSARNAVRLASVADDIEDESMSLDDDDDDAAGAIDDDDSDADKPDPEDGDDQPAAGDSDDPDETPAAEDDPEDASARAAVRTMARSVARQALASRSGAPAASAPADSNTAKAILDLPEANGQPKLAKSLAFSGISVADAKASLIAAGSDRTASATSGRGPIPTVSIGAGQPSASQLATDVLATSAAKLNAKARR